MEKIGEFWSGVRIPGYVMFPIVVVTPMIIYFISVLIVVVGNWSRLTVFWIGLTIVSGLVKFYSSIIRHGVAARLGGSYNFLTKRKVRLEGGKNIPYGKPIEPTDEEMDNIESMASNKSVVLDPNDVLNILDNIRKEKENEKEDDNIQPEYPTILSEDPTPKILSGPPVDNYDRMKEEVRLLLYNRRHVFWRGKFHPVDLFNGGFLVEMIIEYAKSDLRLYNMKHWIYKLLMIHGIISLILGLILIISYPFAILIKLNVWTMLLTSILEMIFLFSYFSTLLWKGCYLHGIYCLYWSPIPLSLLFNFIIFEYSIYLLHYY